jgi:Na+/H+ antiporter NhaD/arsenite permease-like protein
VNDVVCLVMTPFVIALAQRFRLSPLPYALAVATASNIGSVATITGNPQNMLIGSLSGIRYVDFIAHLGPVAIVGLFLNWAMVHWLYMNRESDEAAMRVSGRCATDRGRDGLESPSPAALRRDDGGLLQSRQQRAGRHASADAGASVSRSARRLAGARDGITLAGNLTITGSVANIIVVERASAEGLAIGFSEYFRLGLPLTVAALAVGCLWLTLIG